MMEWLDIVIFTLGGKPVLLVDFISSLLGLTCVFLAGRNSKYNFWVGYLYTAALFFLFWSRNLYANLLLQPISLAILRSTCSAIGAGRIRRRRSALPRMRTS